MTYAAEISRANPTCFLFLIDQSGSMQDAFAGGASSSRKADGLSDAINRILQTLTIKCARNEGVRDYFHVGVIGYGTQVSPAFGGALAGRDLAPISEVASMPARIEERAKKIDDGAGGLIEQTVKFPIWFDPVAEGGTPMCQALTRARSVIKPWLDAHPGCFPPIVMNATDGEATDGNPTMPAESLKELASSDGNVLLFNLHLSSLNAPPITFPDSEESLPDEHARLLFRMSSILPESTRSLAQQEGFLVSDNTRGFIFQAGYEQLVKFLDIGTRASNLR